MDNNIAFAFFAIATLAHLILGILCNNEIKRIPGGYLIAMTKLATLDGLLPKLTSISFFAMLTTVALLVYPA